MDRREVIDLVNMQLTYKPGWYFYATAEYSSADAVRVYYEAEVVNSSPRSRDPRGMVTASGSFIVHANQSRDEVLLGVYQGLMAAESHEAREFLRVSGEAPFHPHVEERERRFTHLLQQRVLA